jgi:Eukaryotic initiation factor 4E
MRHDVLPLWEHEKTVDGGQLQFRVVRGPHADRLYQHLLLLLVCEHMYPPLHKDDRLVGLSASVRRNEVVISLWNAAACLLDQSALTAFVFALLPAEGRAADTPVYRVHRSLADFRPTGDESSEDVGSHYSSASSSRRDPDTSSASPVRGPPATPFLMAASRRTRSQPPNGGRGRSATHSRR